MVRNRAFLFKYAIVYLQDLNIIYLFVASIVSEITQRGVRAVEGARLESVYTPKGYRGFESLPLCILSFYR